MVTSLRGSNRHHNPEFLLLLRNMITGVLLCCYVSLFRSLSECPRAMPWPELT